MTKLSKIHHVGIPVSSIERSLPWYTDVLGLLDGEVKGGGGGKAISSALQVPGADVRFAFLEVGDVKVELLEYRWPKDGKAFRSSNHDVGTVHVCFEVDDIDRAYGDLTAQGVAFNAPPIRLGEENGPLAGHAFAYFRDPDGIQLELFELPS
jgi:catechol 2,3-dioxygenase-like lactoylglutathione lyase family enzyme